MNNQRQSWLSPSRPKAVGEIEHVYTKLLELACTTNILGLHTYEISDARHIDPDSGRESGESLPRRP